MRRLTSVSLLCTLLLISISSAQQTSTTGVPNLIRYSGTLKEAEITAPSGPVGVTFAIYKQQDGGAPIWLETQNVTPDTHGQYSVLLGNTTAAGLPDDLFSEQEQRWLGIQVQAQAEQPRVMLVSVPYAFRAHEAETLGGLPASAFVKAAPTSEVPGGPSTDASTAVNAVATAASGKAKPLTSAPGTPGYIPIWLGGTSFIDSMMYQTAAGNVGVGTTTPVAKLDVNGGINAATVYEIGGATVLSNSPGAPFNLFVGVGAGTGNTTGLDNTFVGTSAGMHVTAANGNTFSGAGAGYGNTSGGSNTIYGYAAGYSYSLSLTGSGNTFVGATSGHEDTSGYDNTFIGNAAGYNNTTGLNNTALGAMSGMNNTTGLDNTFVGTSAGENVTTANFNTFSGAGAGYGNTSGSSNTIYGYAAGYSYSLSLTGAGNTFVGATSGHEDTSGYGNTFIGNAAAYNNTTGSNNTALGSMSGLTSPTLTNATAIGANAAVSESNALVLGGTGANAVNVGIGTPSPASALDVVGTVKLEGSGNGVVFPDGTKQTTAAGAGGVTSWNGRTGAVVPQAGDYNFSQISGKLGGSEFSGTYSQAVTLSNSSNVLYGDGSHLSGIVVQTIAGCISEAGSPPGCPCNGRLEQCIGISNGGFCQVTSQTGGCSASAPNNSYGSCTVCRPN